MEKAKLVRRQGKAAITRHLGALKRLVAEEDVEGVQIRLDRIKASFKQFEVAHDAYQDLLEDDAEIEQSEDWFEEVQANYVSCVTEARAWLKSQTEGDGDSKSDISEDMSHHGKEPSCLSHADLVGLMSIPKVEIDKFEGDPLEYGSFMSVFDELVDRRVNDSQVKLTRLLQYTSGPAKGAIKNCALIGGEDGYVQARNILKNRYGNNHLVSKQIIDSLKSGKSVTKPQELQQLGDDLSMAITALMKMGKYDELNTQQSIIDILRRCQPYHIKCKYFMLHTW